MHTRCMSRISPKSPCAPKGTEAADPGPWSCSCPGLCRSTASAAPSCLLPLKTQPPTKSGLKSELGKPRPPRTVSWSPSRPCPWHARMLALSAAAREAMPFVPAPRATQPLRGLPALTCSPVAPGDPGTAQPCAPCPSRAGEPRLGSSASSHPGLSSRAPGPWEQTAGENVFWQKNDNKGLAQSFHLESSLPFVFLRAWKYAVPSTAPPAARNGRLGTKANVSISRYDFFYKALDERNLERKKRSVRGGSSGIFSWPLGLREMPAVSPSQWPCRDVSLPAARSAPSPSSMQLIKRADGCCHFIKRSLCPRNGQTFWGCFFCFNLFFQDRGTCPRQ